MKMKLHYLNTCIEKIKRTTEFKYFGETIQQNDLVKTAKEIRALKMRKAYGKRI